MTLSILGIDPYQTGAIAIYFPETDGIVTYDIRIIDGEIDAQGLFDLVALFAPDYAVQERKSSPAGKGEIAAFASGSAYGVARGIVAAAKVATHLVEAARWKRYFSLPGDAASLNLRALGLWPEQSRQFLGPGEYGRAAAALLARYGFDVISRQRPEDAFARPYAVPASARAEPATRHPLFLKRGAIVSAAPASE